MTPEIRFCLATFGISLILTYAWWCHFRAWILRAWPFEIRDRLWDAAHAQGELDDPEYRETRDVINSLIRAAATMTWISFLFILIADADFQAMNRLKPRMREVREARGAVNACIANYLLRMTLTGRVMLCTARIFDFAAELNRSLSGAAEAVVGSKIFTRSAPQTTQRTTAPIAG